MNKFRMYIMASLFAALASLTPAAAQTPDSSQAEEQSSEPQKPLMQQTIADSMRNGHVLLNFENIDIRVLARVISELTGRNIIVGDKVNGKLTILSSRPVSPAEAWDIFKAAVSRYGFSIIQRDGCDHIVTDVTARSRGQLMPAVNANPSGEEYVMAIILLHRGNPEAMQNAIKPLLSENGIITFYKDSMALLITDKASVVNRIGRIAKTLDNIEPTLKTEVIFPKYMEAEKVVEAIKPLYKDQTNRNTFTITAFAPSNGVVISAYPSDLDNVKRILKRLDIPMAAPIKTEPARFFVYNLQFAQAEDVAKILSEMLAERQKAIDEQKKESKVPGTEEAASSNSKIKDVTDGRTGATGEDGQPATVSFTSSKVSADTETNSLLLYISPSEYDDLKTIIAKLDSERRQIQIESVVAEVTLKRAEELGIGWQALTSGGLIGSYKGGLTEEGLLNVLAGGNFVAGVVGGNTRTITVSNQSVDVPEFFAYLSALKSNDDFNLISAPRVMTQDNKKAIINVGQVVPFATGGKLDAYGSPMVTFDYRQVGIKLEVTPHMSRTGKIRMDVNQEIQEVTSYLAQEMAGVKFSAPVVSNRSVNTTVTIPDGKTLLIGGLISKRTSDQIKGIPILKDLPIIGGLFRDKSSTDQKTSIFISLTPKIIDLDEPLQKQDVHLNPYLNDIGESGDQHYENRDSRTFEDEPDADAEGADVPGNAGSADGTGSADGSIKILQPETSTEIPAAAKAAPYTGKTVKRAIPVNKQTASPVKPGAAAQVPAAAARPDAVNAKIQNTPAAAAQNAGNSVGQDSSAQSGSEVPDEDTPEVMPAKKHRPDVKQRRVFDKMTPGSVYTNGAGRTSAAGTSPAVQSKSPSAFVQAESTEQEDSSNVPPQSVRIINIR